MDAKVIEDTEPLHWSLNWEQTKGFLASLFPDQRLFPPSNVAENDTMKSVLALMERVWQRENGKWRYFPEFSKSEKEWEEEVADFFNDLIRHTPRSHMISTR
jgi:hypothetical protein